MNAHSATPLSNLLLIKIHNTLVSVQKANTVKIRDLAKPAPKTALLARMISIVSAALNASSPAHQLHTLISIIIKHASAIHRHKQLLLKDANLCSQTVAHQMLTILIVPPLITLLILAINSTMTALTLAKNAQVLMPRHAINTLVRLSHVWILSRNSVLQ